MTDAEIRALLSLISVALFTYGVIAAFCVIDNVRIRTYRSARLALSQCRIANLTFVFAIFFGNVGKIIGGGSMVAPLLIAAVTAPLLIVANVISDASFRYRRQERRY